MLLRLNWKCRIDRYRYLIIYRPVADCFLTSKFDEMILFFIKIDQKRLASTLGRLRSDTACSVCHEDRGLSSVMVKIDDGFVR